jgi:tripartite-type tricarboxylate transporter receptor subunit TctC
MKKGMINKIAGVTLFAVSIFVVLNINLANAKDPDYPTKPVTILISMGAGGATDLQCAGRIEGGFAWHICHPRPGD